MLKREWCGKQREATAPIQSLVNLHPWFLSLWWKTCLRQNSSLGSCACSEGPALGQNTHDDDEHIKFSELCYMYIFVSVINTRFSNSARIFQYLMHKEIYSSSNKIAKSLHVFKINMNLDTAPPLRFFLLS